MRDWNCNKIQNNEPWFCVPLFPIIPPSFFSFLKAIFLSLKTEDILKIKKHKLKCNQIQKGIKNIKQETHIKMRRNYIDKRHIFKSLRNALRK